MADIAMLSAAFTKGIAIMFSIMAAASSNYIAAGEDVGSAMAQGAQLAYRVGGGLVLLALVVALLIPRKVPSNGTPVPAH